MLIETDSEHANWWEVLRLWSRIANWQHYKTSKSQLRSEIKTLLIFLLNEKDWLKHHYAPKKKRIEEFIVASENLCVVVALANTAKHGQPDRRGRFQVNQTNYFGRVTAGGNTRELHFISVGDNRHLEILSILRASIDELTMLRHKLRAGEF